MTMPVIKNPTYAQLEAQRAYLENENARLRASHDRLLAAAKEALDVCLSDGKTYTILQSAIAAAAELTP